MQAILQQGMQLQGRYRIERPISAGGMGEVYKATDLTSGRAVAVKRLLLTVDESLTAAGGPDYHLKRFREEINVLKNLSYQGIPAFVDDIKEDGQQFIIMEFIDGVDLERQLRDHLELAGEPPPAHDVVSYVISVCKIVEYLHALRPNPIIHRDIKPANIILRHSDQRLYLVDFGLARTLGKMEGTRTSVGTVGYAPVEQYQGKPREQSDQYSLGVTLHFLLSGVPPIPFQLQPLEKERPGLPATLYQAVRRATAEQLADRWSSVYTFRRELEKALSEMESPPPTPVVSAPAPASSLDDSLLNAIVNRKAQRQKLGDDELTPPPDDLDGFGDFHRPFTPANFAPRAQTRDEEPSGALPASRGRLASIGSVVLLVALGVAGVVVYGHHDAASLAAEVLPNGWKLADLQHVEAAGEQRIRLAPREGRLFPSAAGLLARQSPGQKAAHVLSFEVSQPETADIDVVLGTEGNNHAYLVRLEGSKGKVFGPVDRAGPPGLDGEEVVSNTAAHGWDSKRARFSVRSPQPFDRFALIVPPGSKPVRIQHLEVTP